MSRSMRQRPRISYAEDHSASAYAAAVNPTNMGLPNIHANPQFLAQQQRMLQANYNMHMQQRQAAMGNHSQGHSDQVNIVNQNQGNHMVNLPAGNHQVAAPNSIIRQRQMMSSAHNRIIFKPGQQGTAPITRGAGPFFGGVSTATGIPPEPPKPPQKPLNANNKWAQNQGIYDSIKAAKPKLRGWEVNKEANAIWREMSQEQKQPYIDEAEAEKAAYSENMLKYYQSEEYLIYQNYINLSKNQINLDKITDGRFTGNDLDELYAIEPAKIGTKHKNHASGPFDGEDDELDLREIAAKRYKINHELISEIFDPRMVVSGWGMDANQNVLHAVAKADINNVLGGVENCYIGAGSVCSIPTKAEINKLKNRSEKLESLIKKQIEDIEKTAHRIEERKVMHEKSTTKCTKAWDHIWNEKPEETYRKWKEEKEAKMEAAYQKQKEAEEKAKELENKSKQSTGEESRKVEAPVKPNDDKAENDKTEIKSSVDNNGPPESDAKMVKDEKTAPDEKTEIENKPKSDANPTETDKMETD